MTPENLDLDKFDFFHLDQFKLDEEWVAQPKLFFKHASERAEAKASYERAKAARDVTEAELDNMIRSDPTSFGIEKPTENAIASTILLQKAHRKANRVVITAKHDMDILQAAVDALDHRKKALENLVHLFAMNYYSEPKAPDGAKGKLDDARKNFARRNSMKGE